MNRAALALLFLALPAAARGEGKLDLIVKETAGIRRFGYPVYVKLELPRAVTGKDRFRLVRDGKPVAAQFRVLEDKKSVALDFETDLGPLGKTPFVVKYGPEVEAGPEPKAGMTLEEGKGAFTVRSGGMVYVVPRDLKGLLKEVRQGKKVFTREGSPGLALSASKDRREGAAEVKARVTRKGPLTVALRFEGEERFAGGGRVPWVVEMTFPRAKSWVEVSWTQKPDEKAKLDALAVELNLLTEGKPTLADFGAGSMVYTTLRKGQAALLKARPGHQRDAKAPLWEVLAGPTDRPRPLARAVLEKANPAEGWAHLMDSERCTAVAVEAFGRGHADEVRLEAEGRLTLRREQAVLPLTIKGLRFWLHFVDMPVQVGALTSPQSMMSPLVVEVR